MKSRLLFAALLVDILPSCRPLCSVGPWRNGPRAGEIGHDAGFAR